jgi:Flp pilus assembly protein TadD
MLIIGSYSKIQRAGIAGVTAFALAFAGGCKPAGPKALLQGKALIERGKYEKAVEKLTKAVDLLRTNAQTYNYLGLAYHYSGHPEEAQRAYERALTLNRDLSEARFNLGCLWLEQNKPELARTELTAFTLRRGNSAEGFLKLGAAQLRSREPGVVLSAEKSFNEAMRVDGQTPAALNGLGMLRFHQGRYNDAQQFFSRALKQSPKFTPAVLNSAIVAQRIQDRQTALARYKEFLLTKPEPVVEQQVSALIAQLEQELHPPPRTAAPSTNPALPTSAVPVAPQRTSTVPIQPPSRFSGATSVQEHVQTPANRTAGANGSNTILAGNGRSTPTNPGVPDPALASGTRREAQKFFLQGSQAQQAHRAADALAAYKKAAQLDPSYFEAHYNLGLAATDAGDLTLASKAYQDALGLVPDSLDARYNYALVLKQTGHLKESAVQLEALLLKYPNESRAHLVIGNLYAQQLQDNDRARQHYSRVLELEPTNSQSDAIRHWIAEHRQ